MRSAIILLTCFVLSFAPVTAVAQDNIDLRPNLKQGALDLPQKDTAAPPPAAEPPAGRQAIPPAVAIFAVLSAIAIMFVVCYPSRKHA